jgi:hypothetical protein
MQLNTPAKRVSRSAEEVFSFLTDLGNFRILLPESTEKFELRDADSFVFALKGMPEITLKRESQRANEKLVLGAANQKLPFLLNIDIAARGPKESDVTFHFNGEFNAMMAMMVKAPISKFLSTLSENLSRI